MATILRGDAIDVDTSQILSLSVHLTYRYKRSATVIGLRRRAAS